MTVHCSVCELPMDDTTDWVCEDCLTDLEHERAQETGEVFEDEYRGSGV